MKAETVVYRDVRAGVSPDNFAEKVLQYGSKASPEFLVDAGTLYLRIQRTYAKSWLYVVVDKEHWSGQKLQQLIKSHPELDHLCQILVLSVGALAGSKKGNPHNLQSVRPGVALFY